MEASDYAGGFLYPKMNFLSLFMVFGKIFVIKNYFKNIFINFFTFSSKQSPLIPQKTQYVVVAESKWAGKENILKNLGLQSKKLGVKLNTESTMAWREGKT